MDGILNIYMNVCENLVVYDKIIAKHIAAELPFMATENIMMECVKAGGNRQELHEKIRVLSMQAGKNVKELGKENNLIELIKADSAFAPVHDKLDEILDAKKFTGRAASQTEEFIANEVEPILKQNGEGAYAARIESNIDYKNNKVYLGETYKTTKLFGKLEVKTKDLKSIPLVPLRWLKIL